MGAPSTHRGANACGAGVAQFTANGKFSVSNGLALRPNAITIISKVYWGFCTNGRKAKPFFPKTGSGLCISLHQPCTRPFRAPKRHHRAPNTPARVAAHGDPREPHPPLAQGITPGPAQQSGARLRVSLKNPHSMEGGGTGAGGTGGKGAVRCCHRCARDPPKPLTRS